MAPEPSLNRQQQKARTREALKRAAVACIHERGFAATRIADITRTAGVAQGTFYVHFASKEALLDDLLVEFNEGLAQRLAPLWLDPPAPSDAALDQAALAARIRRTAEAFLDHWDRHRGFVLIYADRLASGLTVETLRDGINPQAAALLGERLATLLGARTLEPSRTRLAVHGLLALWARIGLQYLFSDDVDRDTAADTLERLSRGALGGLLDDER